MEGLHFELYAVTAIDPLKLSSEGMEETPQEGSLARANAETWLGFGTDYRGDAGIEASRPDEQAGPLVFLCSDAASHVSGEILIVDAGFTGSGITGVYESAAMAVDFMENA